ncbi:nuclear distribution protein nudF [Penicillium cataractarum]|uniref:Nuclear distribution protein nudF n=1 Tax=Penicillium cataractarum TaxID=2100454 RepID=A0A9W9V6D0_9EURO|nr:nuclear distribution protein nudF [Penicillium cataractarum]KAJ5370407.1 nuclear distribution protein nudF [Penicillium cataractarum]
MSVLTKSQATELHKAMIGYLSLLNASKCVAVLQEELQLKEPLPNEKVKKYARILERKWTKVSMLQKQIIRLELEKDRLQSQLESSSKAMTRPNRDPDKWLPSDPAYTLESHRAAVTCIAFHPMYSTLASGSEDCTIKIWDWENGELERTLKGHSRSVTDLDFGGQKGNELLASSSDDLTIKIWDPTNDYTNIRTLSGHDRCVTAVRFLRSGGNRLVSASRDASIRIWDVATGYCTRTIYSHGDWICSLSPSIDGRYLVTGGRGQAATIWDVASGEARSFLRGHDNHIECCVFAPPASYKYLAALGGLKVVPSVGGHAEFVATGARDNSVNLWDVRGRLIKTLIGHDSWVRDLTFHPGGRYLLSVGDDCTVRCWDLSQNGRLVKTIDKAHRRFVNCIRWAPELINPEANEGKCATIGLRCVVGTASADGGIRIFK